nr:unnamed protein product [Digitaria exilis]
MVSREVVGGEVGVGGEGAGGERVGVGCLYGHDAPWAEDAEELWRVKGAVQAGEGGAGDDAAEVGVRGGGEGEVTGGGDAGEDVLGAAPGGLEPSASRHPPPAKWI